mgnify:CR=1 FL=1
MISLTDLIVLVPELFLTGAICVLLIADLFVTQQRRGLTHFLAIGILLLCIVLTLRPHSTGGLPAVQMAFGGMFVRDLLAEKHDQAILQAIIGLAQAFGRSVIAEGVETQAHGQRLLELGCPLAQGYAIARPMPAAQVPGWVHQYEAAQA